jgi:hypothetical protein
MDTPRKNLFTQAKAWREGDRQNKPKNEAEKKTVLSLKREEAFAPYGETKQAQAMPDTSPLRDVTITSKALPKGQLRDFGKIRVKSQASQFRSVSSVHTVMHVRHDGTKDMQVVRDVAENDACPVDPAWKQGQEKIARTSCKYMRKAYIRSREARDSVIVVKV